MNEPPIKRQLPDVKELNANLINAWTSLSPQHELTAPVTRDTVDKLFFALNSMVTATTALQQSLISYSNQDLKNADEHLQTSQIATIDSLNHARGFLEDIVVRETVSGQPNER